MKHIKQHGEHNMSNNTVKNVVKHIHQDLINLYQEGQVWQSKRNVEDCWENIVDIKPTWKKKTQYRLHPHNNMIQEHRNGATIQSYVRGGWLTVANPNWSELVEYRIKPNTKTMYEWAFKSTVSSKWIVEDFLMSEAEAKAYFDGHEYYKTDQSWTVEV
jgi:hypothetical protein